MILQPRDIQVFDAIQRHGPLPSHYLYELTKREGRNRCFFQKRLLALVRERFLERPPQLNNALIRTDFKVYVLAVRALDALAAAGKRNRYTTPCGGGYRHAFMTACVTANIEAGLAGRYRFVSQEAIFAAKSCPAATRSASRPLAIPLANAHAPSAEKRTRPAAPFSGTIEPDQLFGIDYWSGYRFFLIETDRGTEPITRRDYRYNSILRKLVAYQQVLNSGEPKARWGVPNIYILFVTTSEYRMENMIALAKEVCPDVSSRLLFKSMPGFNLYFRTPPLMPSIVREPWERAQHEALNISDP